MGLIAVTAFAVVADASPVDARVFSSICLVRKFQRTYSQKGPST